MIYDMMVGELCVSVRVSSKRTAAGYDVLLVELVNKSVIQRLGAFQLPVLTNDCCLADLVLPLLRAAAAFVCFKLKKPPMSNRVLLQIQDCITPVLLPQDVIFHILLMLPVKTILRFKAVCKTWNQFLSSSNFVHHHFGRQGNRTQLLVCWTGISEIRQPSAYHHDDYVEVYVRAQSVSLFQNGALESPPLELGKDMFTAMGQGPYAGMVYAVHGPCNGILCVSFEDHRFALWNPATRKLWPVPENRSYLLEEDGEFSFWMDPLTNEFKFFWIGEKHIFVTYTSSNDSWKVLEAPMYFGDCVPWKTGYSVSNGFYYFVRHNVTTLHDTVIAYDICKDLFQEIQMPKFEIDLERQINLDLFDDSLALFAFEKMNVGKRAEIWVMKEKRCWTKLFNMDIPVDKRGYYQPIGFWKPNEVLIYCYTVDRPHVCELMIYDHVSGQSRKILVETREGLFHADFFPFCYKESLISFFKIKEARVDDLPEFGFDYTSQPVEWGDLEYDAYSDEVPWEGDSPKLMNGSEWLMDEPTLETSCYVSEQDNWV